MKLELSDIDFFVVGAMKSATSSLCDWLDAQPGIVMSSPKEPGIFVSDEAVAHWSDRLDTLYPSADSHVLRGDGSTDYAKHPVIAGVPERLVRTCPEAKIVYMMRHPLQRTISQFRFEWLLGGRSVEFSRALEENPGLISFSDYALQLSQWSRVLPPERILLMFTEAFARDPAAQVRRVLDFLEVDTDEVVEPQHQRTNVTSTLVRPTRTRRLLRSSWLGRRVRPLIPEVVVGRYRDRVAARSRPSLTTEQEQELINRLDEDLVDLGKLLSLPDLNCQNWYAIAGETDPTMQVAPTRGAQRSLEG
jgi:hypothetical protein